MVAEACVPGGTKQVSPLFHLPVCARGGRFSQKVRFVFGVGARGSRDGGAGHGWNVFGLLNKVLDEPVRPLFCKDKFDLALCECIDRGSSLGFQCLHFWVAASMAVVLNVSVEWSLPPWFSAL